MSTENHYAEKAITLVVAEYARAHRLHGDFRSLHEGYAALLEEKDELWDEIKKKRPELDDVIEEAIQVAAMGYKIAVFAMKRKAEKT